MRGSLHNLQRAMFVLNMNRHKKRTRPVTLARLERNVVDECRRIVREYDMMEDYKVYTLQNIPVNIPWTVDPANLLKITGV